MRSLSQIAVRVLATSLAVSVVFVPYALTLFALPERAEAASVPTILSYQGRLTDDDGDLLGGSGTTYYFKFSIWNNATVGSGSRVWPSSAPTSVTSTVRQGVFSVNIGDTANGYPDTLNYAFDNDTVYLQVEVSSNGTSFETLSPRHQISSAAFAQVAGATRGAGQSSIGTTTPHGTSVLTVEATTTSTTALTLRAFPSQTADLFSVLSSAGASLLSINSAGSLVLGSLNGPLHANNGVVAATTSIGAVYGGTGQTTYSVGDILYASAAGTLTKLPVGSTGQVLKVSGGIPSWGADLSGSGGASAWATSTNDLFVYPGDTSDVILIGASATSTTGNIFEVAGNSLFRNTLTAYGAITAPSFSATSTSVASRFNYATTTMISATTSSSTNLIASNTFTFSNVTGFLKATAGAVATALIDLAADVTGILPVANGGTGWGNVASNAILLGNGTSAFATTTAGTNGQILALSAGVPTWVSTTTAGTGLTYTGSAFNVTLGTDISVAEIANGDHGDFTYSSGSATLDADTVADSEIDYANVTLADFTNDAGFLTSIGSLSIESLSDVAAMTENVGDLLYWDGSTWTDLATSSLDLYATGLGAADFGEFTCNGTTCSLDGESQTLAEGSDVTITAAAYGDLLMHDGSAWVDTATSSLDLFATGLGAADFGDWTCNGTTCSLDDDTVSDGEIDYSTVTLADFTNDADFVKWANATSTLWRSTGFISSASSTIIGSLNITGNSTTTNATTTNLAVTGIASTTALVVSNLNAASCDVKASSAGVLSCGTDAQGSGGGDDPFTHTLFGATNVSATTTALQLTGGLYASSTVRFGTTDIEGFFLNTTVGNVGIGTTSPYAKLSVVGEAVARNFTATSTATSTLPQLDVTGIEIASLLEVDGNITFDSVTGNQWSDFCETITGGSGLCDGVDSTGGGNGLATSTDIADTWVIYGTSVGDVGAESAFTYDDATNKLTVVNASTTNLTVSTLASSSQVVASNSFTFSNVTGFLKATAGAVATALIDLAADVTGILPVANGGTGWGNVASNAILIGNGTNALATTTAGTNGQILALSAGVPTWVSTTTAGTGLTYTGSAFTVDLGTAIDTTEITNGTVAQADLNLTDITLNDFTNDADFVKWTNATSTLWRSAGLISSASSTIGAGTQTTGLTISGGATTTGRFLAQNITDSTTAFQIKDADGGTPIFNVDTTDEKIGIGTAAPNSRLQVVDTLGSALDASSAVTGGTDNATGATIAGTKVGGTADIVTGLNVSAAVTSSGSVTDAYGVYINGENSASTITNGYLLYLENGGFSATNDYGIYQLGGSKNYFADNTGIGTTSPYSKLTAWGGTTGNIFEAVTNASTTALRVSAEGFGTTTLSGLNISASATTTSNLGIKLSGGCFEMPSGTCLTSITASSIEDLSDVAAMTENYGDLLGWNGTTWTDFATSSLDLYATGLGASDFGEFTCNGTTCTLDAESQTLSEASDVTITAAAYGDLIAWDGSAWADLATTSLFNAGATAGNVLMWNGTGWFPSATATCVQITGSAALCDGDDAAGAGSASVHPFTAGTFGATNVMSTTTALQLQAGLYASSTVRFGNVAGTQLVFDSTGKFGFGTTTPFAFFAIQATTTQSNPVFEVASSSQATKFLSVAGDGFGTTTLSGLNISASATTTSNLGIKLSGGCFEMPSGTCLTSITASSIEDLSDVAAMTENYGDLLGWNGTTWTDFATTTLFAGTNGQMLAYSGGAWIGVATTTAGTGLTYTGSAFNVDLGTSIAASEIADADHGDFTYLSGSATLDADTVAESELDLTAVTLADFTNDADFVKWANATSTLWQSAGTISSASSTIGGGTLGTGLTIYGGATSTNLLVTGSTTLANFTAFNATTTSATSTNFFATTASTTNFFGAGLVSCTSNNVLTWSAGRFGCEADDSGSGGSDPFTHTTNYAQTVSATTTPVWFQGGLMASSTSYMHSLVVGSSTDQSFPNAPLLITGNTNSYVQAVLQNKSSGSTASADFIVGGNLMTDTKYYGDLGYNSSDNADPSYLGFGTNSFYMYNSDGEVALATASSTNSNAVMKFLTGGTLARNERMRITRDGLVGVGTTSPYALFAVHATSSNSAFTRTLFAIASSTASATTTLFSVDNTGLTSIGSPSGTGDAVFQIAGDTNAWSMGYYSTDKTFRIASSTNLTANVYFQIGKSGTTTLSSGVGTVSGTDQSLCIDGTTFEVTRQAGDSCAASAARYKYDIKSLEIDALTMLDEFDPVSFIYNDDTSSTTRWGFIADAMASTSVELASFNADGSVQTINNTAITAVLTKAMKEMSHKIEDLATTTPENEWTTESFASRFYTSMKGRLVGWFASATNGIGEFFATRLNAKEEICVDDQCLTKDDVRKLIDIARNGQTAAAAAPVSSPPASEEPAEDTPDTSPPTVILNGDATTYISVGDTYTDAGVVVNDNVDENPEVHLVLDGEAVESIELDTSVPRNYEITYHVVDAAGNTAQAQRIVVVQEAAPASPVEEPSVEEPIPEPTPEPELPPEPASEPSAELPQP